MAPSADDLKVLELAFNAVDKDNVGKINAYQLKDVIEEMAGPKNANEGEENLEGLISLLLDILDVDKDGMLTLEELSKLADYGTTNKLPQMFMTAIIYAADKDNNGWITAAELKDLLTAMNTEDEDDVDEVVGMLMCMLAADDDSKARIDVVLDFLVDRPGKPDPKEKYKMMFRMCDINKDGMISKKEFKKFMNINDDNDPLNKAMLDKMMEEADKDGDGQLNYEEFCAFLDK